jgi:hypothetical protein
MSEVSQTYIYCATRDTPQHRGKRSTYLVEMLEQTTDNRVVARISPMPMVRDVAAPHEVALNAIHANLVVRGNWNQGVRHSYIEATPRGATPPNATTKPTQPKPLDRGSSL